MKRFTSVILAGILCTAATIALSQNAEAGNPRDWYEVNEYREYYPHRRERYYRGDFPHRRERYYRVDFPHRRERYRVDFPRRRYHREYRRDYYPRKHPRYHRGYYRGYRDRDNNFRIRVDFGN